LGSVLLVSVPGALSRARDSVGDDERERVFVEALRLEDPGGAERYLAFRDARGQAISSNESRRGTARPAGSELRLLFLRQLRAAQRQLAESSLALLDFLDTRDRRAQARYQEEISRINRLLEQHTPARAEFEKLLRGE